MWSNVVSCLRDIYLMSAENQKYLATLMADESATKFTHWKILQNYRLCRNQWQILFEKWPYNYHYTLQRYITRHNSVPWQPTCTLHKNMNMQDEYNVFKCLCVCVYVRVYTTMYAYRVIHLCTTVHQSLYIFYTKCVVHESVILSSTLYGRKTIRLKWWKGNV